MIKALIFDFDGTIADTLPFAVNQAREINRELKLLEEEKISIEDFRNVPSKRFISQLGLSKLKLLRYVFKFRKKLKEEIDEIPTFEGIPEVLKKLKEKGIKVGIATSNSKSNVKLFLDHNNLDIFDFIYSSTNLFGKNEMLKRIIKRQKIDPSEAIYIGDETRDIEAAKKIGIKCAGVTWGYNAENILEKHKPDYLVRRPVELLNLVN